MSKKYFQPDRAGGTQGPCRAIGQSRAWLLFQRCLTNISWPQIQHLCIHRHTLLSVTRFWRKHDCKCKIFPLYAHRGELILKEYKSFVEDISMCLCTGEALPQFPHHHELLWAGGQSPLSVSEASCRGVLLWAPGPPEVLPHWELPCFHVPQYLFMSGLCCQRDLSWMCAFNFSIHVFLHRSWKPKMTCRWVHVPNSSSRAPGGTAELHT